MSFALSMNIIGRFPRFIPFLNYMGRFEYFCNRICLAYILEKYLTFGIYQVSFLFPDDLCSFKDMQLALRVHLQQTLCEYIVWALMLLYRQKSSSKIILTKWFYF